jgi:Flp pilus assembly protein TadD
MHRYLAVLALCGSALHAENVLILPFFNHSKAPGLDWIGESISEAIHDSLASEGVLVLDREDRLEAYRRLSVRTGAELTHASILKIGQALDATNIVYGTYEVLDPSRDQSKGSLLVRARVIDLKRFRQGPDFSELGALEELAVIETRLSWQTISYLSPGRVRPEEEFVRSRPAVRLDAAESYVRGLMASTTEQRHRFFTQAARLDEHYSQPRFQLGKAAWVAKDYQVAIGWLTNVNRSDPHFFEGQFLLGLCRYRNGDFAGAEQAFQLVAATVPLNEVYNDLGAAQSRRGNMPAAQESFAKALEGDSTDPDYHFNLGYVLWRSGKFAESVASLRAAVERNPADTEATTLLGRALKQDGPRPGETRFQARERLKTNYEETAYRQLQAELHSKQ